MSWLTSDDGNTWTVACTWPLALSSHLTTPVGVGQVVGQGEYFERCVGLSLAHAALEVLLHAALEVLLIEK